MTLKNLLSNKIGAPLRGKYFYANSCAPLTKMAGNTQICAAASDSDAIFSHEIIPVSSETLGVEELTDLSQIYIDTPKCAQLACAKRSELGYFYTPIDGYIAEAELDAFSEVQAYYSADSFFSYIKKITENEDFCLRDLAMKCSDESPEPMEVAVNQMLPSLYSEGTFLGTDPILAQIESGRGTIGNPVVLETFTRVPNAAFVPAVLFPDQYEESLDDALGNLYTKKDRLVLFQGILDYAYDADIVFHELMHGVTHTLLPNMRYYHLDRWGASTEPGALNEAWSDYFSASFTNAPEIGEYTAQEFAGSPPYQRTMNAPNKCPDDYVGQVHEDANIVNSALWKIRQYFIDELRRPAIDFDRMVFDAIRASPNSVNFSSFSNQLLMQTVIKGYDAATSEFMKQTLTDNGMLNCSRATSLLTLSTQNEAKKTKLPLLFISSPINFGVDNYIPSPIQFKLELPAGATGFELKWEQYFDSSDALISTGSSIPNSNEIEPLRLLVNDKPIEWVYENRASIPKSEGHALPFDTNAKETQATQDTFGWKFKHSVSPSCEPQTLYVSAVSLDHQYFLENIEPEVLNVSGGSCTTKDGREVSLASTGNKAAPSQGVSCNCSTSSATDFGLLLLLLFALRKRAKGSLVNLS